MGKYQFEICTNSVESCLKHRKVVQTVGTVCRNTGRWNNALPMVRDRHRKEVLTHTRLHVIIRPRGGDFLYSDIEIRTMLKDIEIARKLGDPGHRWYSWWSDSRG